MDVSKIENPEFLKNLSIEELNELSGDIRKFLIESVAKNGGHLSGNLGIVELTIALHRFFGDEYKFIFDVGHQCYTHKILTGRGKYFGNLRKKCGTSGFQQRLESDYDIWEVAHSSTSLAAELGFLKNGVKCIGIIGDGALTGGEAWEALSNFVDYKENAIIIINDNSFSISKNVGFTRKLFDKLRSSREYRKLSDRNRKSRFLKPIKNWFKSLVYKANVFDDMGFKYYGPINGHDFKELFKYFGYAKEQNRPVILHVCTEKGKGYTPAEKDEIGRWHSVSPFNIETGESLNKGKITFNNALNDYLMDFYNKDNSLKVVMPAMTYPSGMQKLRDLMKDDYIDTGISEEFATSFSASLALSGSKVVLPIYSSFLQRSYDQLFMDICMQNAHVVLCVLSSGLIPSNGKTHQGIYDISYLRTIPNLEVLTPSDEYDLKLIMDYALNVSQGPIAIHIPSYEIKKELYKHNNDSIDYEFVKGIENKKCYIMSYSSNLSYLINNFDDEEVEFINIKNLKNINLGLLKLIEKDNLPLIVYEDAPKETSLYSNLLTISKLNGINLNIHSVGLPLSFIGIGTDKEMRDDNGIGIEDLRKKIEEVCK